MSSLALSHDQAPAEPVRRGFWRRLLDAAIESRLRKADRLIAAHIARRAAVDSAAEWRRSAKALPF